MKKISIALALIALIAAGCSKEQGQTNAGSTSAAVAQANLTPEELGELGAKIKKQPSDAQRLLQERGLTEESFEQQIRKVAEDPQASKRYSEAYRKASA